MAVPRLAAIQRSPQCWWIIRLVWISLICLLVFKVALIWVENSEMRLLKVLSFKSDEEPEESIFGLSMEDYHLTAAVRELMVWPPARPQPYNLKDSGRKHFSQKGQDEVISRLFFDKKNGVFMEAGALNGERYSNTLYFERELGWTGILVEPAPDSFIELVAKNRKSIGLNACLAPTEKSSQLLLRKGNVVNALNNIVETSRNSSKSTTITVPCFPIFTILQASGHLTIDYLSLDIEGPELKVLKTIPWDKVTIKVIDVEMNHVPEGEEALKDYLLDQGYRFFGMVEIDGIFYRKDYASELNFE